MRNVTGDPRAGVLPGEEFDITPYAGAYVRYFVRHPTTQAMPRKVKTAFASTAGDNTIAKIHDMAFLPTVRDGVRGVEVLVGGGTSIMPRLAPTLYDFVELDNGDYLKVTEACMRIFDRHDWLRVNRARARIKVLVDKIGIDAFRETGRGGADGRLGQRARLRRPTPLFYEVDEEANAPAKREAYASPNGDLREFDRFVVDQRRPPAPGRASARSRSRSAAATSRPTSCAAWARSCASTAAATPAPPCIRTSSCAGCARTALYEVWRRLSELDLGDAGADEISDVVSCPGTDSCKLGHHELDGSQPGHPGPDRGRWTSTTS